MLRDRGWIDPYLLPPPLVQEKSENREAEKATCGKQHDPEKRLPEICRSIFKPKRVNNLPRLCEFSMINGGEEIAIGDAGYDKRPTEQAKDESRPTYG